MTSPISFIYGNINHTYNYIQDLCDLIATYQQEYNQPTPNIAQKTQDIDLNFVLEDLPKTIDSMRVGAERIHNIILSLRNFSRLDESELKPVDVHQGIDSTLLILQNRLHAHSEDNLPEIKIIKEYAPLPRIVCYASELNQVFLQILNNAIDAVRINPSDRPPQIAIRTQQTSSERIEIKIADNGPGISKEVQRKILVYY